MSMPAFAATHVSIAPIPAEVRSDYFAVTINGKQSPVIHAAGSYYLLNFDLDGPATVSIRAPDPHYWDRGVEIQPMRYGIRPTRNAGVITFRIPGPAKLSVSRPDDHFADSQMLFLLGSPPGQSRIGPSTPGLRYYGSGLHRENIEAHSGDHIYLAPGAVVFGSLTLWQVHDVHIEGRGIILYDGPQNSSHDEGWMQKPDWHCIVMDQAQNVEIDGITCIVRSRTWQIQMRDSRHIGFYNVNIIGGHPRDANQDGMDWLGGGDTTVRNCFIRASDDDFAIQGNWEGYSKEAIRIPGHDVTNITIEDSVVSTSISNTMRVGWPRKTFSSAHVSMRNLDVIHTGFGACVVPFAFFELWADPGGNGSHTDYRFSDIRLEDWYSLLQIRYPNPGVRSFLFSNIAAFDGPTMTPSVLQGDVSGVVLEGVRVRGEVAARDADIPLQVSDGAARPTYQPGAVDASFDYASGLIRPHQPVSFRVLSPAAGWHYRWLFGDGAEADGESVRHAFPDTQGTLLDGSGRFRVLLRAWRTPQNEVWISRSVVVAQRSLPATGPARATAPGLASGPASVGQGTTWEGWLRIPAEGGYTVTLLASRRATLAVDDLAPVHSPELRIEVCGSLGDAVQPTRISVALRAGLHRVRIDLSPGLENEPESQDGSPMLYWEGPGTPLAPVPPEALVHARL